jgi:hypothetical protein
MNTARRLICLLIAAACLLAGAMAQVQTSELHVVVKDTKGAVVSGASVTAAQPDKGVSRAATTNAEGIAILLSLPPGLYSVSVESPGFAKLVQSSVHLTIGQVAELAVELSVAAATETVTVSSEAALVETQQTSSGTTIDQTRIENLPINGRNYVNFALTNSQLARDTTPSIGAAPTSGLNIGGQRGRSNLVNIDGTDATDDSVNGIRTTVSQDAVQEFQIITNGYAAEYGRASGGVINIISKSGTNEFHGSAFGYLRSRYIQATNPFSNVNQPAYTRAQYGIAAGGPIKKDRTYWFFAYEGTDRHETGFNDIGTGNFGLSAQADISRFVSAAIGQPLPPNSVDSGSFSRVGSGHASHGQLRSARRHIGSGRHHRAESSDQGPRFGTTLLRKHRLGIHPATAVVCAHGQHYRQLPGARVGQYLFAPPRPQDQ